jgi:WD40 repeat protein
VKVFRTVDVSLRQPFPRLLCLGCVVLVLSSSGESFAQTSNVETTFEGHLDGVTSAWVSGDGQRALTGSLDQSIRYWSAPQANLEREYTLHTGPVHALAVSGDETTFVSASQDNTVRVWRLPQIAPKSRLSLPPDTIRGMASSSRGDFLVSVGEIAGVHVHDFDAGSTPLTTKLNFGDVAFEQVTLRSDGAWFAAADRDHAVHLGSPFLDSGQAMWLGHEHPVLGLGFAANGQQVVSADSSGVVRFWRATPAAALSLDPATYDLVFIAAIDNGASAAGLSRDGRWRVWNCATASPPRDAGVAAGVLHRAAVHDGTKTAAAILDGNRINLTDLADGNDKGAFNTTGSSFLDLSFSGDGNKVVTVSDDGCVRIWKQPLPVTPLPDHSAAVSRMVTSDDGQWIWISDASGGRTLRSVSDNQSRPTFSPPSEATCDALHPAVSLAVIGAANGWINWWNPAAPEQHGSFQAHSSRVTAACFHASSNSLISCGEDGTISRWSLPLPNSESPDTPPPSAVWTHAFEPSRVGIQVAVAQATGEWAVLTREATTVDRWSADFTPNGRWEGASAPIEKFEISKDGKHLISTTTAGGVVVWADGATAFPAERPRPPSSSHWSLSPDGLQIAWTVGNNLLLSSTTSGGERCSLPGTAPSAACWLGSTGRLVRSSGNTLHTIDPPCEAVWNTEHPALSVMPLADGSRVAVGTDDGAVVRVVLTDGNLETWIPGNGERADWLTMSRDGQSFVTTSSTGAIRASRIGDGSLLWQTRSAPVVAQPCSSSNSQFLFVDTGNQIQVFSLVDGTWLQSLQPLTESRGVMATNDARVCVSAGANGPAAMAVSIERSLQCVLPTRQPVAAAESSPAPLIVAFTTLNNASQAAVATADGHVQLVDLNSGNTIRVLEQPEGGTDVPTIPINGQDAAKSAIELHANHITAMAVREDNQQLAVADASGMTTIWNLGDGAAVLQIASAGPVVALAFSPDNQRMAMLQADGLLRIFGPPPPPANQADRIEHQATRTFAAATSLLWNRDGQSVWCAGEEGVAEWAYSPPTPLRQFNHGGPALDVAVSHDGNTVVSCSTDQTVRIWDVTTGQQRAQLQGHQGAVLGLDLSADATRAISCGSDGTLRLWDVIGGRSLKQLFRSDVTMFDIAFDPSAQRVVGAGSDRRLHVIAVDSGAEVLSMEGHSDFIHSVTYSPDGRRIASYGYAGELRLWDAAGGTLLWETRVGNAGNQIAYSSDGLRLVVAGGDRKARVVMVPDHAK